MPASRNTRNILQHKRLVASYLEQVIHLLCERATLHDLSKFDPEEFDAYEAALPRFEQAEYGSEEYIEVCRSIKPALEHHVTSNRHHPEYFGEAGMSGMTLIDLLEMVCDWIAASQRTGDTGAIFKGLPMNKERFHISDQLFEIIERTVDTLTSEHTHG